jgi:hypothetical protein
MEAFVDVQHCYNLLGTSNIQSIASAETRNELDLTSVRGNYHFNEMKRRRTDFFHDIGKKGTENNPIIHNSDNEDDEISPKYTVKGQFGSRDDELMTQHSKAKVSDQAMKAEKMACSEGRGKGREGDKFPRNKNDKEIASGSVSVLKGNKFRDEKVESSVSEVKKCPEVITDLQGDRALQEDKSMGSSPGDVFAKIPVCLQGRKVLQSKKIGSEINGKLKLTGADENVHSAKNESKKQDAISEADSGGNKCDPNQIDVLLLSEESEKLNKADAIQNDNSTIKEMDEENATGRESETERQAALEYVVNATLAHVAYFAETYQEAYVLAKYVEHV